MSEKAPIGLLGKIAHDLDGRERSKGDGGFVFAIVLGFAIAGLLALLKAWA